MSNLVPHTHELLACRDCIKNSASLPASQPPCALQHILRLLCCMGGISGNRLAAARAVFHHTQICKKKFNLFSLFRFFLFLFMFYYHSWEAGSSCPLNYTFRLGVLHSPTPKLHFLLNICLLLFSILYSFASDVLFCTHFFAF